MQQRKIRKVRVSLRRSPVWKTPDEEFRALVKSSSGVGKVLEAFGLENVGRNHHVARARITELKIDTSHFNPRARARRPEFAIDLKTVLIAESSYHRGSLKRRLIKEGYLKEQCAECGLPPMWNDKPLVLQLDHENGKRHDARITNLRLLCPNCHSQQPTHGGSNLRPEPSALGRIWA